MAGALWATAGTKLGKVKTGRSCINFKKLEDLNLAEAIKLVKQGAKYGGMNAVT